MRFDVPIVVFGFKRKKITLVLDVIKQLNPCRIYLLCDGGRNENEWNEVYECRAAIDQKLSEFKETEIFRIYSDKNLGVYQNIGCGAANIFKREECAIFVEDDNLPELSFFYFCREMLVRYKDNQKILWVCGSNYLEKYDSPYSYVFTQHMLPCGWASWSEKFLNYYDGNLINYSKKEYRSIKPRYVSNKLFKQFDYAISLEKRRIVDGKKPLSWDYQMDFSIKYNNLFGICPCNNQIRNIGADDCSIHGGTSLKKGLSSKFCEKRTFPVSFPLIDPPEIQIDKVFEKKIGKIMLPPFKLRLKSAIFGFVRRLFKVPYDTKFKDYIKRRFHK